MAFGGVWQEGELGEKRTPEIALTSSQALYLRMRGQGLIPGFSRVAVGDATAAAARFSAGLQAQDLFAATLSVRVRAAGSTLADFERSRLAARSVVWTWLMRGTLHLVPAEDLDWLLAVLGQPLIAATARRRAEIGLNADVHARGLEVVLEQLASGPATREELSQALTDRGVPNGYSIERYLLFCAALEGRICYGPDRGDAPGSRPTFTLLPSWLGRPLAQLTDDQLREARVRLVRRYLDAFRAGHPDRFLDLGGRQRPRLPRCLGSSPPGIRGGRVSANRRSSPDGAWPNWKKARAGRSCGSCRPSTRTSSATGRAS